MLWYHKPRAGANPPSGWLQRLLLDTRSVIFYVVASKLPGLRIVRLWRHNRPEIQLRQVLEQI